MISSLARAAVVVAALAGGTVLLAGCTEATLSDLSPKASKQLPPELVKSMRAKGMTTTSPIMARIFKEENKLEIWKQKDNGRYDLIASYDICKWSGRLGPKFTEGDRQAPEGFYTVRPHQMNPNSSYHLSFNMGFPNAYDRAHGRTGQHLMVHGACSSAGCYSMTDEQVEQIYAFGRDAFKGGQTEFQIQAFPFRMTAANMARYKDDPNYEFWSMLKEGYDHFEITRVPPKVDVCGKRYVFNSIPEAGSTFQANAACPAMTKPEKLETAYSSYQSTYETAFNAALSGKRMVAVSPSIAGVKEAALVAEWSRRRARGEKVTREPPTLARPHILAAEQQAAPQAAAVPALPATTASVPAPATPARTGDPQAETAAAAAEQPQPTGLRKRLLGMFSN